MRNSNSAIWPMLAGVVLSAIYVPIGCAYASGSVQTLYSFKGGSDGVAPYAGLIVDSAGNLYGTTREGGKSLSGTVFKLSPNGTETVLYSFKGGTDGLYPVAGVIKDKEGNLYGTTEYGGAEDAGTVFKLASDGTETILHSFTYSKADGILPIAGLVADEHNNLYGTASYTSIQYYGAVFKVSSDGDEKIVHYFDPIAYPCCDGGIPSAGLIRDKSGNLYGTTAEGGAGRKRSNGLGTVFKIASDRTETVLKSFDGSNKGGYLLAGVVEDSTGNFYGTTAIGGANGGGVVFKLDTNGTETVLHSFRGGTDGAFPVAGLSMDSAGNLYGTTVAGGGSANCDGGCGTVFKLAPDGTEDILYSFNGGSDGALPNAGVIAGHAGYLHGTTTGGGAYGYGTVFRIKE